MTSEADSEELVTWPADDPRWWDETATHVFGPRPPSPLLPRPPVSPRSRVPRAALIGAALTASAFVVLDGTSLLHGAHRPPPAPRPIRLGDPPVFQLPDGRTFGLGAPGDWLVVGDWDCDGHEGPALYRPSTGVVYLFARWATDSPLTSDDRVNTGILDGQPAIATKGACETVVIHPLSDS